MRATDKFHIAKLASDYLTPANAFYERPRTVLRGSVEGKITGTAGALAGAAAGGYLAPKIVGAPGIRLDNGVKTLRDIALVEKYLGTHLASRRALGVGLGTLIGGTALGAAGSLHGYLASISNYNRLHNPVRYTVNKLKH